MEYNLFKIRHFTSLFKKIYPSPFVGLRNSSSSNQRISQLQISENEGVRQIILSNPKTRNALSLSLMKELKEAIIKDDPNLRCVVLSAEGKVFSAGHNLKELTTEDGRCHHEEVFQTCSDLMLSIQRLPVPVIAQVSGVAAAAGCQLVASCDIVLATDQSMFSTPGGNVGIFCSTPGIPLVRNVPRKVSAHMLLTGLPINASQALQAGLVSSVVPEDQLDLEMEKTISAILSKSKSVIALGKKFMYSQMELGLQDAYRAGSDVMVNNINMKDGQEGINSFIKKKKPIWSHSEE